MALAYDDYLKIRDAKKGDKVTLSTGEVIEIKQSYGNIGSHIEKPTKNTNLDYYDNTYMD